MGEVYRVRDTRLDRIAAIKVLPAHANADPEFRQRFEREARSISALDHPHICTLYDVGQENGVAFLVMQYLEGETLAARLARSGRPSSAPSTLGAKPPSGTSGATTISRGPMPIEHVLRSAREIASALDAAHRRGIVHRDLKPGNVMLTKSGVKLLDFGLAKLADQTAVAGFGDAATRTTPLTSQGALLGTLQYMSPEQLEGKEVDARSDLFAFGTMLFEMLTGRQPFESQSHAGLIAAIIGTDTPPLDELADPRHGLSAASHRSLNRLLRKCLAKDPDERWQCAGDLAHEIKWIEEERLRGGPDEAIPAGAAAPAPPRTRERIWMAAAAVLGVAAAGLGVWPLLQPAPAPALVRFTVQSPDTHSLAAGPGALSLSPDGRRLAFVANASGRNRLWIRAIDSLEPRLLQGTEGAWQPVWSPNGRFVAFQDSAGGGKLKKVDIDGGLPIAIADFSIGTVAWSTDGTILFTGRDRRLYRISENGGSPVVATEFEASRQESDHSWPFFLSDGRRFIFQARGRDATKSALFLGSLDSPARTHLVDVLSSAAYAKGYLFYQRDGTLMAQPFDEKNGRLIGEASPLIESIDYNPGNGRAAFSVSASGDIAYRATGSSGSAVLTWLDAKGGRVGTLGDPGVYRYPRVSPDGRRLAVSRRDEGGNSDVFLFDLDRGIPTRLTFDPADEDWPIWSHDGSFVVFASSRKGRRDLYRRGSGGAAAEELLFESSDNKAPTGFSPDGKLLLFNRSFGGEQKADIWALPMTGDRKPFPVIATTFNEGHATFSPNGQWIAYDSDDADATQLYVQPFPATGEKIRLSTTSGGQAIWSRDGKQIFYTTREAHVMAVDVTNPRRPGTPKELFAPAYNGNPRYYAADASGERFLFALRGNQSDDAAITIVLNWTAGLNQK